MRMKIKNKNHPHQTCGDQFLSLLADSFHKLHHLKRVLFCNQYGPRKQLSGVFYDLEGVELSQKLGGENPRTFSYVELYIGTKGFSEGEVLGSGGFGKVYKACLPSDSSLVAVKCLIERGENFQKTLLAELVAVAHLRHKNLVRLRGWCVHEDQLLLVYDYMPNRSLDTLLFKRSAATPLDWNRRRAIIGGLASALHYLHEQLETQIIHRDVKASNVMLDSHYNARLGDFGLARWLEHELEYQTKTTPNRDNQFRLADTTRIGGTIGYLPPESFKKQSVATAKSDVFGFGIVVLEIVTGRRAIDLTYPDDQIILLDWIRRIADKRNLLVAVDPRIRDGSYSLADMERLIHLALLCTLENPQSRPNMKWVVQVLFGFVSGNFPPLPSFHSHPPYITISSSSTNTSNVTTTMNTITVRIRTTASSNTTSTSISSNYITAAEETVYATAETGNDNFDSSSDKIQQRKKSFVVETPREISYKEIIVATNNFSDLRRVAELDFGTAYLGFLENHDTVLVKRLGMTKCPALRDRFSKELQNLTRLRHRNLVQLRGWCTEKGEMLVVYDYSANQFLSNLLFKQDYTLSWYFRFKIIKSLASAILYLHEEWEQQVIHRNITSSAVIVDEDMNPRLTSFALAEFLTQNDDHHAEAEPKKTKSVRGIFGYMSPEYVESGEATTMADVYSFGVLMLEIVTGQMAVDFRRPEVLLVRRVHHELTDENENENENALIDARLEKESDDYNKQQVRRVMNIGKSCTRSNPEIRPSMRQVVSMLDGNEECCMLMERRKENRVQWKNKNGSALSLIRSIQALGIQ